MSTKLLVVTGATGQQGGSVARHLSKNPEWRVRAVTRNPNGEAAKALVSSGIEVVKGDNGDLDSLVKAFEGAYAVFGLTNFWDALLSNPDNEACGKIEGQQSVNLAIAASRTPTLKHYIFATLQSARKLSKGKVHVPHMDYKAEAVDHIIDHMPKLAAKTTFFFAGFYPSNLVNFPNCKPIEIPGSYGAHIWVQPSSPNAQLPQAGDVSHNSGVLIEAILNHPSATLPAKYVNMTTEIVTFAELLKTWQEISGKRGTYVQCSTETFTQIWGPWGLELALQYEFGEAVADWNSSYETVGFDKLGLKDGDLKGVRDTLEGLKAQGVL